MSPAGKGQVLVELFLHPLLPVAHLHFRTVPYFQMTPPHHRELPHLFLPLLFAGGGATGGFVSSSFSFGVPLPWGLLNENRRGGGGCFSPQTLGLFLAPLTQLFLSKGGSLKNM